MQGAFIFHMDDTNNMKRKTFAIYLLLAACSILCPAAEPLDIGARRELFVDDFLIEKLDGVQLRMHHPQPREVTMRFDQP